jgi:hypothetical protein
VHLLICLSVDSSICLFVRPFNRMSIYLSNHLSVCICVCLSPFLPIYQFVSLSIIQSIYLSVCSSICLSVNLPITFLSVFLSSHLSVCKVN